MSALLTEESHKMKKILRLRMLLRVLLFGSLGLAAFYLYLLRLLRFTSATEMKCFIPDLLRADPVYVFAACR